MKTESRIRTKAYIFVFLQFLILAALVFYPFKPALHLRALVLAGQIIEALAILGIVLAAVTIRSSLTILPQPKSGAALGTSGFYKYVRHPMYSLVILFAFGSAIEGFVPLKFLLAALLVLVLYLKSRFEEKLLIEKFNHYVKYKKETPRFIPLPRPR